MRIILLLLALSFSALLPSQSVVRIAPEPSWITQVHYTSKGVDRDRSYQFLLLDRQVNYVNGERYARFVYKVMSPEGVESMSDISTSYDPSYQSLTFHSVNVIRGGQTQNRLTSAAIKTFQREENMERLLYDGSITASINLKDVRVGDIIEYAYSIEGINPIHRGNISSTKYLQYTEPILRIYQRLVFPTEKTIKVVLKNDAPKPKITSSTYGTEYVWNVDAKDGAYYESNVPSWYDMQKKVRYTSFGSWGEIVDWAKPMFKITRHASLPEFAPEHDALEDKILACVDFVQEEVRYLGFESGVYGYKPNQPQVTQERRFGDCKDKSLLLVDLLQQIDVRAYPVLVHSSKGIELSNDFPNRHMFNHCIVQFWYRGKPYFIDPTANQTFRAVSEVFCPSYKWGLLLRDRQNNLTKIPDYVPPGNTVRNQYEVNGTMGDVALIVESTYQGSSADRQRRNFKGQSKEKVSKDYLNFYSKYYTDIELGEELTTLQGFADFTVREYYNLRDYWKYSDDSTSTFLELFPVMVHSNLSYDNSPARTMPYDLGSRRKITEVLEVELPGDWQINDLDYHKESEYFEYDKKVRSYGSLVMVTHTYEVFADYIPANATAEFLKDHKEIRDQLSYFLQHPVGVDTAGLSITSILLAIILIGVGLFLCIRLYRNYNPKPKTLSGGLPIGGWMILPLIGLFISPILILVEILQYGHFSPLFWTNLQSVPWPTNMQYIGLVLFELVYDHLVLVYVVLLLILFLKRRSSLPNLICLYYIGSFVFLAIDFSLILWLIPELYSASDKATTLGRLVQLFVGGFIWIPYFQYSERVKQTFTKTYQRKLEPTTVGDVDVANTV